MSQLQENCDFQKITPSFMAQEKNYMLFKNIQKSS